MATKMEMAVELYKQNAGISNNDFIDLLVSELGMTTLGARTYCYNVRKQVSVSVSGSPDQKVAIKKQSTKIELNDSIIGDSKTTIDIPYEQLTASMQLKIKFNNVCA